MDGLIDRIRLGRGAVALVLAYALILQGVLYAIGAGLAASPANTLTHVLCTPGSTVTQEIPGTPAPTPDCCVMGCASIAGALPAPDAIALPARIKRFAAVETAERPQSAPLRAALLYPLGARAPPVLS
ncbi:hypothetical protein SAMN05216304_101195 [Bosea sp. OK403]|uniref:hypothetical protein n=1 Tax=Bosea sp. OK403 TaxID=1855286 RepID=UPI0008EE884F|nr:hypothetical protein [Bosea sp. OK403]SFH97412.1 hypothetical protein SAMN05216304_101195 [Bosea sp. OK403]